MKILIPVAAKVVNCHAVCLLTPTSLSGPLVLGGAQLLICIAPTPPHIISSGHASIVTVQGHASPLWVEQMWRCDFHGYGSTGLHGDVLACCCGRLVVSGAGW
jgi:hypothetical protein